MRLHIRLNPKKEDNRLITRWLARYHTGTQRQGIIKACLAAEARAFFAEAATRHHAPPAPALPTPVVIPSFTNLGQLIQAQPSRATAREPDDIDRTQRDRNRCP